VRLGLPAYETSDWINNGTNGQYSRGHMSPSADWQVSDGDNAPTFFLTNMLPQNQDMNGGPWGAFENYLRTRAVGTAEIYIVSGGIFTKDRRGPGMDGFGTISNNGKIAIPDSIWKVAVIVPDARGIDGITPANVEVIAINTPNESPASGATYSTYFTTVDKIQRSTGYDLLGALPESVQCRLETRNCAPTAHITGAGLAGGAEGQSLHFDATTSSDVDGTVQQYQWSVDGVAAGSGPTLDHVFADNGTYQVRLVVTDNGGATDVTTSSVSISNVAPSIGAIAGGTVNEGSAFTAAGSFADPGDDSWSATVDYGDGSGVQPLTLAGKSFSLAHTYANNGSYTITVTVTETDVEAASGSQSATVTVANVTPVVAAFSGATILRGETYASSGTFADPGADTWTATVDYGDGAGASTLALTGNGFTLAHRYDVAGVRTVTVAVFDGDATGTRAAQVTVLSSGQGITALASMVSALASSGAMQDVDARWLANKLDVAAKELARGNEVAARNQLQQAVERIEAAQRAGRLSSTDAATISTYLNRVLASMA
jgi:DNA/RNA endonuclease G, NUC1